MKTPIFDFVSAYAKADALRLHMPGHKGVGPLGLEKLDITEIDGADSLYEAGGIIAQSEANASHLFGCKTLYSTEGSSQCIRAMLYLVLLHAKKTGRKPLIAAGRNAHKTFLSGAALLDMDVDWLYPEQMSTYLSCALTPEEMERYLASAPEKPAAVYLTSPDYLGRMTDIAGIARVCHAQGVLLAVDNAHGAYLRFLEPSLHPIDLGADFCCDSAHKTLPVLTGGAYLHIAPGVDETIAAQAKTALALFGSTSPSYLIMQSLDLANACLCDDSRKLQAFAAEVSALKQRLMDLGYVLYGDEPLKITLEAKKRGYVGHALASLLLESGLVCEYADPDHVVLMLTPEIGGEGLSRIEAALAAIPQKPVIGAEPPRLRKGRRVCSVREAMLSPAETLPIEKCCGRVLAAASVGCPPAVPILICGEEIDQEALECFRYYGIKECTVLAKL